MTFPTLRPAFFALLLVPLLASANTAETLEETQTQAALAGLLIRPSRTDPEIKKADFPHWVQLDRDIILRKNPEKPAPRQQLLLWLTGTGGTGRGAEKFCTLAAQQGYHVIKLAYPNDIPASFCRKDEDPESFEKFRLSLIQGGEHPHISISSADSIENRLIKLLQLLNQQRPQENWQQFLSEKGEIQWDKLAIAGQSQGGGHAMLLGIKHRVARVIATGAPKDWSVAHDSPAAWLKLPPATPRSLLFTFNHQQDYQGCTPDQQWVNLQALDLGSIAPLTNVDDHKSPFRNSRMLVTNWPGTKQTSGAAHTSVIADKNADLFGPVWLYMLTEPEKP